MATQSWEVQIPAPPSVVLFGAGPESAVLIPLMRKLGWLTAVVETRKHWLSHARLADSVISSRPAPATEQFEPGEFDAALVLSHSFELDLEALQALAGTDISFIGLLGPMRRRDDLLRLLPASSKEAIRERLRSPVGISLGGKGAEVISVSIAAQLEAFRFQVSLDCLP